MTPAPDVSTLWHAMVRNSPIGVCQVDPEGHLLAANPALCEMLGYTEAELRQLGYDEITHPDDLERSTRELRRAIGEGCNLYRIVKRYVRSDGEVIWVELTVALVHDPLTLALQHMVCQVVDITEQHRRQEELESALTRLSNHRRTADAVLDAVDVGLVQIHPDGSYGTSNRRHAELLREAFPAGHAGRAGAEGFVFGPDRTTPLRSAEMPSTRAVAGEEFDDLRIWVGADESSRRALSVSARVIDDGGGEPAGVVLAYHDVTELATAISSRDRFLATVSHELRSPLTALLSHLELILDDRDVPPETRRQAAVAQRNALRLAAEVANLVDVARPATTALLLEPRWVDLTQLAGDVVESVRPLAEAAGIALEVVGELPTRSFVDAPRVRQVVDNLVVNAIKYSDGGRVTVEMSHDDHDFVVAVRDGGIGIADTDLPHVFEPFFRADQAAARRTSGIGLGLSIAREIVAEHGGCLEVESELGRGSTFRVRCPIRLRGASSS